MTGLEADVRTAYTRFGEQEARGNSPLYERVCALIAANAALLARIGGLPPSKRQPNLVLAAARFLGAPDGHPSCGAGSSTGPAPADEGVAKAFVAWMQQHWDGVAQVARERLTQTNEVGRCATLLPFITEASAGRPVALVEVGCSAGLALHPDLFSYRYPMSSGELTVGDGSPELVCRVRLSAAAESGDASSGNDIRQRFSVPVIAWRGGVDLNPLDVVGGEGSDDDAAWLQALVWPGQRDRAERLRGAIDTVRAHRHDHPDEAAHVHRGDVVADLDALLAEVPADLPLVLFHSAVLAYVDTSTRDAFEARMAGLAARPAGFTWISNEAPAVLEGVARRLPPVAGSRDLAGRFVLAVNGAPRALTGPHGQSLELL